MWFSAWIGNRKRSFRGGRLRKRASPGRRASLRPQLEVLEDRCVPSAGALDPTFGVGGKVTTDFLGPTNDFELAGTVLQPDGKIVLAGSSEPLRSSAGGGFAVARYNTDGSLDTTFGTGGKVVPIIGGNFISRAQAVALQGDGKIVAAGWAYNGSSTDFAVIRYNPDGSLDTTFGTGGEVLTDFGFGYNEATAIMIQGDGKIVVAGEAAQANARDFALARYNSDGSLDTTFGTGGEVLTAFGGDTYQGASSLAIQSNGDIVAAGASITATSSNVALARYTPSGSLDTTFGSGGEVLTAVGNTFSAAASVAIQGDGKIVASGTAYTGTSTGTDFALVRYNSDCSVDTTFGSGGETTTDFGSLNDAGGKVAIQSNGDIVAVGDSYQSITGPDFALARYTPSGSLDTSFGSGGKVLTDFGNTQDYATGLVLQTNGAIVAAGDSIQPTTGYDFAVARYTAAGTLDSTFGSGGKVTTNLALVSPIDAYGRGGVAIQADGKLVVAGAADRGVFAGRDEFALARYNANGTLDTTFGSGGRVSTSFPGQALATSEVIQPDGKIVLAGTTLVDYRRSDYALVRYNPDGSLDTTFGNGGMLDTDFGSFSVDANSVALQADGKIVVAGDGGFGQGFSLARYNPDGTLDTSFGTGGKVLTAGPGAGLNSVAIQADGKIVGAGHAALTNYSFQFALVRYTTSGSLDTTFGKRGEVLTSLGSSDEANSVAIQPDGKIVAAGVSIQSTGIFALARYNSDGSADKTFGKNGQVTTEFAGTLDEAFSVALQGDGKIVAAGESYQGLSGIDFALARYNIDGSLDTNFGKGGLVVTDFGGISQAIGVAIDADGNIVAAGTAFQNGGFEFAVARYLGVSPSTSINQIYAIISNVQTLAATGVLTNGQGNALQGKLQDAIEYLADGLTTKAVNELQAFVNEVTDFISKHVLTSAQGQLLIDEADAVIALLGGK